MASKAKKKKFYTVWIGHSPGVYGTWNEAKRQVDGYPQAKYKSFDSKQQADAAFDEHWSDYYEQSTKTKPPGGSLELYEKAKIVQDSICVDAACSGNPGKMEYRGVDTFTGAQIFKSPVFPMGTNNIGEFLGLVHALALYHADRPQMSIYSDSKIALNWVEKGKMRTKLERNSQTESLFVLIDRAEKWLASHKYKNPLLKWDTRNLGEIPADFGRK